MSQRSLLRSVKIQNFRSIGEDGISNNNIERLNLIIGQNNTGKSNLIRAFEIIAQPRGAGIGGKVELDRLDTHNLDQKNITTFTLGFDFPDEDRFIRFRNEFGSLRLIYQFRYDGNIDSIKCNAIIDDYVSIGDFAYKWWADSVGFRGGAVPIDQVKRQYNAFVNDIINACTSTLPRLSKIPEFRRIQPGETYDFNGTNLIKTLAEFKEPDLGRDDDKAKFGKIRQFFCDLMSLPDADLSIPPDHSKIIVDNNGLRLPLESYGTGVHQTIILLTAILSNSNAFFAIEEPEIHLHPRLQKHLINFLFLNTNNEFLISTHSSAIVNAVYSLILAKQSASIIHVEADSKGTKGRSISNSVEILSSIRDLGVSASEVLQANCLIWVEGPSDRVYLKRWLSLFDPALVEDIHYHFLFYGGRLLKGYSLEDVEAIENDLVNILKINRNSIIVIDSDKKYAGDTILEYKSRVQLESSKVGTLCWVTSGREIENYLPEEAIEPVFSKPDLPIKIRFGQFSKIENILSSATFRKYGSSGKRNYAADKVKYASRITKNITKDNYLKLDLGERLREISRYIRKVNSLPDLDK